MTLNLINKKNILETYSYYTYQSLYFIPSALSTSLKPFTAMNGLLVCVCVAAILIAHPTALALSSTFLFVSLFLSSPQGEQGPVGSPGAKGYPGRQVQ